MNHKIEIPEDLFERLKKHATPLVDTTVTVIERLLNQVEAIPEIVSKTTAPIEKAIPNRSLQKFNPSTPPDLFHTRCQGTFDNQSADDWNGLLRIAHIQAFAKTKSFDELRRITHAQILKGNHFDKGYRLIPKIGISLQGVDANRAWSYTLRLAKFLNVPVRVLFEWRDNEKAAHPGESGMLEWSPTP